MSNCMAVVTGLSLEYAPSVMGGEYAAANTGTLGTQGNANGLFTVYNFQVADYHTYFAAPEADKPFVWVHNAGKGYGKNRGLTFVEESLGVPKSGKMKAARQFENGTTGAYSSVASKKRMVPALKFDNPNPAGKPYVKFDGIDGQTLIDAKTKLLTFSTKQGRMVPGANDYLRVSEAARQNPGFRIVYEFPTTAARREAQAILRELGITNIATRVRQ